MRFSDDVVMAEYADGTPAWTLSRVVVWVIAFLIFIQELFIIDHLF